MLLNLQRVAWKPKKIKNCVVCNAEFCTYRSDKVMCTDCRKKEIKRWNVEYNKKHKDEISNKSRAYYKEHKQKVYEYNKKRAKLGLHKTVERVCEYCGSKYYKDRKTSGKFCSRICSNKSKMKNSPKICLWCGREFYVSVSQEVQRNRKCCSRKCGARYKAQFRTGEKSNLWRGGVSSENRKQRCSVFAKEWRLSVFVRDGYTCQFCKAKSVYLHAHHIKTWAKFPELRFATDNGVTLCKPCHKEEHRKMKENENYVSRFSV